MPPSDNLPVRRRQSDAELLRNLKHYLVRRENGAIDKLATLAEDAKLEQAKLDEAANLAGGRQHPTRHVSV